ncbi:MAG TPA: CvpA family protein [Candidatus Deferrimicrobiaceae bacterium]|nr:CvpA family protein [Candidatus Deferrimicrobiaceae bacterium]
MDQIQAFDLVIFLALLAMFIAGYAQGLVRRLLGTAAILFSIVLGALLRPALGGYLEGQWIGLLPAYSHMVAFAAVFVASAVTISLAIQLTYRPAPLLTRYPVLDEILGGIVGVVQGIFILIAVILILDPYYTIPAVQDTIGSGEFTLLRTVHDLLDDTWTAAVLRDNVIPPLLSVFGFLFPADIIETFGS